jgi:hypothetical protein
MNSRYHFTFNLYSMTIRSFLGMLLFIIPLCLWGQEPDSGIYNNDPEQRLPVGMEKPAHRMILPTGENFQGESGGATPLVGGHGRPNCGIAHLSKRGERCERLPSTIRESRSGKCTAWKTRTTFLWSWKLANGPKREPFLSN